MAAELTLVADAVAAALNAADLGLPFTAARAYRVVRELPASSGLTVTVVPAGYAVAPVDLGPRHAFDCTAEVWVQKRVEPTNAGVDPLVGLAQAVVDLFRAGRLPGYEAARFLRAEVRPADDPRDLADLRLFSSTVSLTFRVTR